MKNLYHPYRTQIGEIVDGEIIMVAAGAKKPLYCVDKVTADGDFISLYEDRPELEILADLHSNGYTIYSHGLPEGYRFDWEKYSTNPETLMICSTEKLHANRALVELLHFAGMLSLDIHDSRGKKQIKLKNLERYGQTALSLVARKAPALLAALETGKSVFIAREANNSPEPLRLAVCLAVAAQTKKAEGFEALLLDADTEQDGLVGELARILHNTQHKKLAA